MSPPPIRAVLFDAVGTLIELREPVGETYARVAADHGVQISAWRLGDAFRRTVERAPTPVFPGASPAEVPALERAWWREVVRQTFQAADSAARLHDFDAAFASLFEHYAGERAWVARPGARAILATLASHGVASAVVSNFDRRLPGILDALGLSPDAVVLPSDAGAPKPEEKIFRCALERLGIEARHALFVGDDAVRDVAAARAVGMRAVDVGALATLAELASHLPEFGSGTAEGEEFPA